MNPPFPLRFLYLFLTWAVAWTTNAATLSIQPNAISSQYAGHVSWQIGGLTNGEPVILETYADFNANGTNDADDLLVQSFAVTDGVASVIGGVTNIHVPGDLNPAGATITTEMNYALSNFRPFVGDYVCRVVSPTGRFAPVTTMLTVTNADLAQTFTGAVRSDGTNVPHAWVAILMGSDDDSDLVAGAISDASGNFTVKLAPGTYQLVAVKSGYVNDLEEAPQLTIETNASIQTNLFLIAATQTISGRIVNAANTNQGIAGVRLTAESDNAWFGMVFSEASGDFNFPVTTNVWRLNPNEDHIPTLNYMTREDDAIPAVDTLSGSVANFNIPLAPVTALIYGNLRDSGTNPIADVFVEAYGQESFTQAVTDSDGYYVLGVAATNWQVQASSDDLQELGYSGNGQTNVGVNAGQAVRADLTVAAVTAHLMGRAVDAAGNPLSNINLFAGRMAGGGVSSQTDGDGNFNIGLTAGTWFLQLSNEDAQERGLIGPSLTFTLGDGTNITGINLVAQLVAFQITGFVRETNGNPITFVGVSAISAVNGTNYVAYGQTDGGGNYSLGVFNGTWSVGVSGNDLSNRGFTVPFNQNATVSGGNATVNFTVFPIQSLQITTTNLPPGVVSRNYHTNLQATGGQQPYNWSIVSGVLPPGISLNSGLIQGIPTNSGTFNFAVQVSDQQANTTNQNLSITIHPALQITTISLPNGTNGQSYSASLSVSGGLPPYTWQMGGTLPAGLSLNTNTGAISGTPTNSGTHFFTVLASDASGSSTNKNLSITITPSTPPLQITTTNLTAGAVSQTYHVIVQATGGQAPYNWSLFSGSLPPGLSFVAGAIDGTPTNSGTFNFTVQASDQQANTANQNLSITIHPTLQITTTNLPDGTNNEPYLTTLTASGGFPPYHWQISGTLPAGLNLNTNTGAISGTPTNSGPVSFMVWLNDSAVGSANKNLAITIHPLNSVPAFLNPTRQVTVAGRATVYLSGQSDNPPALEVIHTNDLAALVNQSASVPNANATMTARAQSRWQAQSFSFEGSYGITANVGNGSLPFINPYSGANAQFSFTVDQDTPYTFTCDVSMTDATADPAKTFTAVQGNIEILEFGNTLLSLYLDRQSRHFYTNSVFRAGKTYHFNIGCNGAIARRDPNYTGSAQASFQGKLSIVPELQATLLPTEIFLRWPANYSGYGLESAPSLAGPWTSADAPTLNGSFYEVHSLPTGTGKFYRLKKL